MHSVRVFRDTISRRIGLFALPAAAFCLALGACASVRPETRSPLPATPLAKPVAAEEDVMLKLLAAQFALQGNDLAGGAQGFTEAADLSADPALSEEATRLALSVKNWPLARRALTRWQQLAPRDPGVTQARAWLALGEKRPEEAYADLEALAARGDDQAWRLIAQTLLGSDDKAAAVGLLGRLATPP